MTGMHRMKVQYIRGPSEDSNLSLLSRHHTRSDSRSVDDFEEPAIEVVAPTSSSSSSSAMLSTSSSSLTASFDLSREEAEFLDLDPPSAQPPSGWRARRKNKKKRQEQIQQELQAPSSPQSSFRRKRSKSVPHSLYRAAQGDDGDFGEPPTTTTTTASNDVEQQISPSPRGLFARLRNLGRRGSKKKKKEVNPLDTTHRWVDNGLVKRSLLNPNAMEEFRTIPEEDIVIEEEEEDEKEKAKEEEEEKEKGDGGGKDDTTTPDISTNDSTESLTTWLAKHIDIKPQPRSPPSTVPASPTAGTKKPSPKADHESLLMMHNKKKKTFLLEDDDQVSTTSQSSSSDEKPRAVIKLRRISRRMNSSPAPLPQPPVSPPRPVFARSVSNPDFSLQPTKPSLKKQATVGSKSERPARRGLIKDDNNTRSVSFSKIQIREYARTVGDNPSVSCGPPLALDWRHNVDEVEFDVETYEELKHPPRDKREYVVPPSVRHGILMDEWGCSIHELERASSESFLAKQMRFESAHQSKLNFKVEEVLETTKRRIHRVVSGNAKKKELDKLWDYNNPNEI